VEKMVAVGSSEIFVPIHWTMCHDPVDSILGICKK
jgi:hypothetical protein